MAVLYLGDNAPDGTSIGLSITEKISFYGVTPIVQRSAAVQATVTVTGAVAATSASSFAYATSAQANGIFLLVNELRNALVAIGAIKGS